MDIGDFEKWLFAEGKAVKTIESYVGDVKVFSSVFTREIEGPSSPFPLLFCQVQGTPNEGGLNRLSTSCKIQSIHESTEEY